ncbi:hypothetical protein ACH42_07065 [Endozoicomonas sp. (ex Bugula neritina AB1)]|nr:hypothetical protein ACH42_07065 [Endozoicomonas sp. (ex Bugula neritina AB1)]
MSISDQKYELKQVYFHSSTEHQINGKRSPFSAHFVHSDPKDNIAVIAVAFEEGDSNIVIEEVCSHMSKRYGVLKMKLSVNSLLPEDQSYYRFNGSLTTPSCSEGMLCLRINNAGRMAPEAEAITLFTGG